MFKKGFTLIEIILSVTIITFLAVLVLPTSVRFYQIQQLDAATNGVIQALRRAQLKALSQGDNNFGVYVGSGQTGQYSLFKGDSYDDRTDEEIFEISNSILFSGVSEALFSKAIGRPTLTGTGDDIVLTQNTQTKTININETGRVNLE
ncbi:type II secretion system GspH family protein [Patescibacteria group bacterium]|nr:type II secretion system GspH family protein [Patescibacteria group bacterium]